MTNRDWHARRPNEDEWDWRARIGEPWKDLDDIWFASHPNHRYRIRRATPIEENAFAVTDATAFSRKCKNSMTEDPRALAGYRTRPDERLYLLVQRDPRVYVPALWLGEEGDHYKVIISADANEINEIGDNRYAWLQEPVGGEIHILPYTK